jgi:threonine synthase
MPELVSTRDPFAESVPYTQTLLNKAPDGGLYIPEDAAYPQLSHGELTAMSGQTYEAIALKVKSMLIGDAIPADIQASIVKQAYNQEAFPLSQGGNLAPVAQVAGNLLVQNLSLGPTAAFKDFGLRSLAGEVGYLLERDDRHLTILAATSGDTGSAAESAFKGNERVSIFMLSPQHGMSPFQKAQMGELSDDRIHNLSVKGAGFTACQDDLVKAPEFRGLGAVNSINWGRIVGQVPYYFSGYLQAIEATGGKIGDPVDFVVPTGNFGNVFSGHVARSMGLPIRNLIIATNENNVVHELVQTGEYIYRDSTVTSSPSMDISVASNYERLVYEMLEGDPNRVNEYMTEFQQRRRVSLRDQGLGAAAFKRLGISSGTSTHQDRLDNIKWALYQTDGEIVIDPHTADAVAVARQQEELDVPTVCLGTAGAVKFEDTIYEATRFVPKREARFLDLEDRIGKNGFVLIKNSVASLKRYIEANS